MSISRDALLAAWRASPSASIAVELAAALVAEPETGERNQLIRAVGREARERFPDHADVLLAIGRMYLASDRLIEARSTLEHATSTAPADPRVAAALGEALLRIGDAKKARAVLGPPAARGKLDASARTWVDLATRLSAIQDAAGQDAVAREVVRALAGAPPAKRTLVGFPAAHLGLSEPPRDAAERTPSAGPPAPMLRPSTPPRAAPAVEARTSGRPPRRPPDRRALGGDAGTYTFVSPRPPRERAPAAPSRAARPVWGRLDPRAEPTSAPPPRAAAPAVPPPERASDVAAVVPRPEIAPVLEPPPAAGLAGDDDRVGEPAAQQQAVAEITAAPEPTAPIASASQPTAPIAAAPQPTAEVAAAPRQTGAIAAPEPAGEASASAASAATTEPSSSAIAAAAAAEASPSRGGSTPDRAPARAGSRGPGRPFAIVFALTLAIGLAGGAIAFRFGPGGAGSPSARAEVESALRSGARADRTRAEGLLERQGEAGDLADLALVARVLHALEDADDAPALEAALAEARAEGGGAAAIGAGEITLALVAKDRARARELAGRAAVGPRDGLAAAARELAAGAALEASGDVAARARYEAALVAAPGFVPAERRLVRLLLLAGDRDAGARRLAELSTHGAAGDLAVLRALAAEGAEREKTAREVPIGAAHDALARPLRAIARGITLRYSADASGRAGALSAEIAAADAPASAAFLGTVAVELGERDAAEFGAARARELAPADPATLRLEARVALARGDLAGMQEIAARLDPESGTELRAVAAYEAGDLAKLEPLAAALARDPRGEVALAAVDRLRGAAPLAAERRSAVERAGALWGEAIAADAALDAGDLPAAAALLDRWPDARRHPLRAARLVRRLRYEGRADEARAVLEAAVPARVAPIDRALLAASKAARARLRRELDAEAAPERRWLNAYLHARDGAVDRAVQVLGGEELPGASAQLSVRVAAGLALAEMGDKKRGRRVLAPLLAAWPGHPDVVRAASRVGLVPKGAKHTP